MKIWIRDPKNRKPSVTLTLLVVGFIVCLAKLILSDLTVDGVHFGAFTGSDFAIAIGAIGALYWGRRFQNPKTDEIDPEDPA